MSIHYKGFQNRPELWLSLSNPASTPTPAVFDYTRLRIIYPDGKVEYYFAGFLSKGPWRLGCTTRTDHARALEAARSYGDHADGRSETFEFLGYL